MPSYVHRTTGNLLARRENSNLIDASGMQLINSAGARKCIIGVGPVGKLNNPSIITACDQANSRKRTDNSLFGATQSLEIAAGFSRQLSRFILGYHFIFAANTES